MAFRLRADEPVGDGLKRVVKKELRSAAKQLADAELSDEAIHNARTSVKKVRAVLQLLSKDAPDAIDRDVKRLRRSSQLLSPLRDAHAVVATADDLCKRGKRTPVGQACAMVREALVERKARVKRQSTNDETARKAGAALRTTRQSVKHWRLSNARFSVLADGLKRAYKRARRAMERARERDQAPDFHRWRKRIKALWYGLLLLEARVPHIRRQTAALKRLQEWLGEDHNLRVLQTQLARNRRLRGNRSVRPGVTTLSHERQSELRQRALALGARVFAGKPKKFVARLRPA